MKKEFYRFILALFCLTSLVNNTVIAEESIPANPPKFQIFTEDWMPFQFQTDQATLDGMAVELLELILKEVHSEQDRNDMYMIPWARAIRALSNENTIVFSMTVTEERLPKYQWVGPIYNIESYVYVKANSPLSEHDFHVNNTLETAIVIDDVNFQYMPDLYIEDSRIYSVPTPESPISMLDHGRVDFIIDNSLNFREMAQRTGRNEKDFKRLFVVDSAAISYAISPKTSENQVHKMQYALDGIKASSVYVELLKKYSLW